MTISFAISDFLSPYGLHSLWLKDCHNCTVMFNYFVLDSSFQEQKEYACALSTKVGEIVLSYDSMKTIMPSEKGAS